MSIKFLPPASDDPEPHLYAALQAMRGGAVRFGDGFVTIEIEGDAVAACCLAVELNAALAADKALGEQMA